MTDSFADKQAPYENAANTPRNETSDVLLNLPPNFKETHEELKTLCSDNAEFFAKDSSENGQRLYLSFLAMIDNIEFMKPSISDLQECAHNYDFDSSVPANGYRSFLLIVDYAVLHGIQLCKKVCLKRESVLFRKTSITKEIECCSQLLASLGTCLTHISSLISISPKEELFPYEQISPGELIQKSLTINKHCFYGRSLGFQYCESIKSSFNFIAVAMAIFSEAYYSKGSFISKATNSFLSSTKYITDPEQRAKRIVNIFTNADVYFCKSFWFLAESELMQQVPRIVAQSVQVSKIINIPAEPLKLMINGQEVEIPVPESHIGIKPIQVRLISDEIRKGMDVDEKNKSVVHPASRGLVIHCHGGGFVAQSSKAHETYLRDWAKALKVPILSIDYSLAPEAPFPRALEEVTYVCCWALKNYKLLGSTGERIVGAGDSAGANLMLTSTLKCLDLGLRPLMGIFVAYVPTRITIEASPSRFLSVLDPLLPFGFLIRCLKAYTIPDSNKIKQNNIDMDAKSDTESFEEISESDLVDLQARRSPVSITSDTDTLTYGSLTSQAEDSKDQANKEKNSTSELEMIDSNMEQTFSQQNVTEFLDKYVLESDTDTEGFNVPVLKQEFSQPNNKVSPLGSRMNSFVSSLRLKFDKIIPRRPLSGASKMLDVNKDSDIIDEFKFSVPKNPYMSPYFASDEALKLLPPVKVLTVHLDPCLDDCVAFAKKLKNLGNDIHLDVLSGLPHGFLNFSMVSKEAHEGSKLCTRRIAELLNLDSLPPLEQ